MRRPAVSLLLMGAVLLLTVGAAVATFKGLGDDGEMRASLEESSTPIVEDDAESRTTEDTTSKKETTSKTDKTDRKTRAEKGQKTPKAEKSGKTTRAGKSGGKSAAGKGGGKARSGRGGNLQQASGGRAGRTSGEQDSSGYEAVPTATLSQIPEQVTGGTPSSPTSTGTPGEGTLSPGMPGTADVPAGTGPDDSTSPNQTTEDDMPAPGPGDTTGSSDLSSPEETEEDDTPEPNAGEVPNDSNNPTSPEDDEDDTSESGTDDEPTDESSGDTPAA